MYRPLARSHVRAPRRGTSFVLIVVVWISLFAVVGTGFALYAIQQARYNSSYKDAAGGGTIPPLTPPDPTNTVNAFFGGLLFDLADGNGTTTDLTNALRGQSIARSMYGRDVFALNNNQALTTPWAGVGLFHEDASTYGNPTLTGDRARFVNNMLMTINGSPFLLDPEYTGARPIPIGGPIPQFVPTMRTYVNKAAGYSYPDLKDFFAGSIDPATGQVLTQSFYRSWSFASPDPINPGKFLYLDPTNPNWTNATGQLYILRPRPGPATAPEHPNFPRVPPDADGVYRGDVQNWPGGYAYNSTTGQYYAQNDSLWMNIGLPTITLPGGKVVQPLVAPLILPVNGLLNASAHGNTYFSGAHGSYAGYGPWEVNLGYLLANPGEAASVVNARGNGSNLWEQRIALTNPPTGTTRAYSPYVNGPQPDYAPVAWNNTAVTYPAYPNTNSIVGLPSFNVAANNFQNQNTAAQNHPSLFNPTEWLGTAGSYRTFMTNDLKYLNRFAYTPDWYGQASVTQFASLGLKGSYNFTFATAQTTVNGYRLDPAHTNRALVTPRGYNLDRPKSVPNFVNRDGNNALGYGTGPSGPYKPTPLVGAQSPTATPYPYPSATTSPPFGTNTDFTSQTRWSNVMSALGSINLNRQLTDYRQNTNAPLSAANMGNQAQANQDRQQFATDIFVRLIAALGAGATVNPSYTTYTPGPPPGPYNITATIGSSQYNALRYLAQLSVNIVDYIDNDDISTVWNWNPADTTGTGTVYGVEKPRLVINEAYSEITNDPATKVPFLVMGVPSPLPAGNAHVRFWLELVNPTNTLSQATGPLGNGSVPLSAYRVEISRPSHLTGASGAFTGPSDLSPSTGSFQFQANQGPDIAFSLNQLNNNNPPAVSPNNGAFNPAGAPASGMALIGPQLTAANVKPSEYSPDTTQAPWSNSSNLLTANPPGVGGTAPGSNSMVYTMPMPNAAASLATADLRRHVVLLRRLANPYMAAGATNPYITVDVMDYVPAFDAALAFVGGMPQRSASTTPGDGGYDAFTSRFSIGKVQPYAGHSISMTGGNVGASNQPGVYNTYTFPTSMVLAQAVAPAAGTNAPKNTFGQHNGATGAQPGASTYSYVAPGPGTLKGGNGAETIMTPFDWYVHMDRPLVNQIELFPVRDTPGHLVEDQFVLASNNANSASGLTYAAGVGRWRYTYDGLARALEYLTVKPYTAGVPYGGRVPGQINVNDVQDQRVINALFDPQTGNGFDLNFVDNVATGPWQGWMGTRSGITTRTLPNAPNTIPVATAPGQSVFDTGVWATGTNRPFMPFGAPAVDPGSLFAYGATGVTGGPTNMAGQVIPDYTILRADNQTTPYLYAGAGSATSNAAVVFPPTHPNGTQYTQAEPVRKIFNNTTTVNHQYVVFLTIGYFDVDTVNGPLTVGPNVTIPRLGAETFINVPGDMRQKFVALVDMSNMALNPTANTLASVQPFFTSLESTTYAAASATLNVSYSSFDSTNNILYIAADGQQVPISLTQNTTLVVGYGAEQQIVTVTGVGQGTITVTGLTRTAWSGACVSNVRPGYPGPQAGFNAVTQPILPYIERLK